MDKKLIEMADALQKAVCNIAPQVWKLAVQFTLWGSLVKLATGFIALALAITLSRWFFRMWKDACDKPNCGDDAYNGQTVPQMIVAAIGGLICWSSALCILPDTWNWVGVFAPQAALFHQLLDKVSK